MQGLAEVVAAAQDIHLMEEMEEVLMELPE